MPTAGPAPRLYVEYLTQNGTTFGPAAVDGVIGRALKVGWAWYSRFPANAFFTLRQGDPDSSRLLPLQHHIRIYYHNPATGYFAEVYNGRLTEPDSSLEDVIWSAWNYQADLSLSRTGYRTMYAEKLLGTEIAKPEWDLAQAATYSLFGHIDDGTFENPLGVDDVTLIKTDARFGVVDVPRLLFMYDLTEIGRANTLNNVTFEISRGRNGSGHHVFNFWKNKGSFVAGQRLMFPGNVRDYRFVPGFRGLRNDLATIGTTSGGGATEIIKTDEANAAIYGRRQDVFTIKTLAGMAGGTTEQDAQTAITARAVKEATNLARSLEVDLRPGTFEPFNGWDIEDTVRVQIARGRDNIDADYRILGVRGVQDQQGYHQQLVLKLPTQ